MSRFVGSPVSGTTSDHNRMSHEPQHPAVISDSHGGEHEYLVDLARATRVDALVTGDVDLLELRETVPVVTPREFLAFVAAAA